MKYDELRVTQATTEQTTPTHKQNNRNKMLTSFIFFPLGENVCSTSTQEELTFERFSIYIGT